jgi:hypothetical protein
MSETNINKVTISEIERALESGADIKINPDGSIEITPDKHPPFKFKELPAGGNY